VLTRSRLGQPGPGVLCSRSTGISESSREQFIHTQGRSRPTAGCSSGQEEGWDAPEPGPGLRGHRPSQGAAHAGHERPGPSTDRGKPGAGPVPEGQVSCPRGPGWPPRSEVYSDDHQTADHDADADRPPPPREQSGIASLTLRPAARRWFRLGRNSGDPRVDRAMARPSSEDNRNSPG